jgi:hypothetical protein
MIKFGASSLLFGTLCFATLQLGSASPAAAQQSAQAQPKKCQVTAGANKGKTGVFTDGGTWCEGKWGGTECGTNRCKAIAKGLIDPGEVVIFEGSKNTLMSSFGYFQTPENGVVGCTIATPADKSLEATAICEPVATEQLESLTTSGNEEDRRKADAVSRTLRFLPSVKG